MSWNSCVEQFSFSEDNRYFYVWNDLYLVETLGFITEWTYLANNSEIKSIANFENFNTFRAQDLFRSWTVLTAYDWIISTLPEYS